MKNWETQKRSRIYRVLSGRSNAYLISTQAGDCLVDTGTSVSYEKLVRNIGRCSRTASKIDMLILTHTHFDHCQSARRVQEEFDCRIAVSALAANYVESGYTIIPGGTGFLSSLISEMGRAIGAKLFGYPPFHPDILLDEREDEKFKDGHIRIINTKGHSNDSVSILVDDDIALVGDAMFGIFRNSILPPLADDPPEMIESWRKLLDTGCRIFLPGHGTEISRDLLKKEYINYALKYQPVR